MDVLSETPSFCFFPKQRILELNSSVQLFLSDVGERVVMEQNAGSTMYVLYVHAIHTILSRLFPGYRSLVYN